MRRLKGGMLRVIFPEACRLVRKHEDVADRLSGKGAAFKPGIYA
jgi:hypothetical protein